MNNISNFCLTLNPEHEEMIRNLSYIPVGLGERVFSKIVYQIRLETQYIKKIHFMGSILFIIGFGKII